MGGVFIVLSLLNSCLICSVIIWLKEDLVWKCLSYNNPLVIMQSSSLLLYFASLKITSNSIINWIARSAFAAYIIHDCTGLTMELYKKTVQFLFIQYEGIICLISVFLFITIVFFCAILLDQIRIILWKKIDYRIC